MVTSRTLSRDWAWIMRPGPVRIAACLAMAPARRRKITTSPVPPAPRGKGTRWRPAAPAYAGIPVTHRDHNTSFTIATGHEDPTKGYSSLDFAKLANPAQTLVFLMAMGSLAGIVAKLRENGMPGDMPVGIVREGTKPTQATIVATLDTIVAEVERTRFAAPAIVVIGNVVRERETIRWFDTTPLFGKRVLVTRPLGAAADDLATRLWEAGAEPVLAPTIEIVAPDDPRPAREAVARLEGYAWVVFTSANGVDACFDLIDANGGDARRFGRACIAAIGPKTAQQLAARGIRPDFVPAQFVSDDVAAGLLERTTTGDRVLLFGAQEMRDVLAATLRARGRVVDAVAGYATRAVRDERIADLAETSDVWTFASGSAVKAFLANVPGAPDLAQDKIVACIGPVTATVARQVGLTVDVVADSFTAEGLIAALELQAAPVHAGS